MKSTDSSDEPLREIQFSTHEPVIAEPDGRVLSCIACNQPIETSYYALADQILCPTCRDTISVSPKVSGLVRFAKAFCFGTLAGLLGALIWYMIRVVANIELGLIAILVGFMVGKAVHYATAGKGGILYQILAVLITYSCISVNYVPDIFQALMEDVAKQDLDDPTAEKGLGAPASSIVETTNESATEVIATESTTETPQSSPKEIEGSDQSPIPPFVAIIIVALITLILALASPVLMGFENPIGLLIIGFALWEAWKFSATHPLPITGPYQVDSQSEANEALQS